MSQENVDTIRSLYDGYRRKDIAAIFQVFAPDIEVYQSESLPWGGRYRGHEQVSDYFGKIVHHIDSVVDLDEIIDAGDHVVAIGRSRGRLKANGREVEVAVAHVWAMRDGKAVRGEIYIDTPKMLNALSS